MHRQEYTEKLPLSRWFGWAALLAPNVFASSRTIDEVNLQSLNLGSVLKVAVPVLAILIVYFLRSKIPGRLDKSIVILVLFSIWNFITSIWSDYPSITFVKSATVALQFTLAYLLVNVYHNLSTFSRDLSWFIQSLSVVAICDVLIQWSGSYAFSVSGSRRLMVNSLNLSPNTLATLLSMTLFTLLFSKHQLVISRLFINRIGLTCICSYFLILTKSRLTIATFLVILIFLFSRRKDVKLELRILSTIVLVVTCFVVIMQYSSNIVNFYIREQSQTSLSTLSGRTYIWSKALEFWAENRWFGRGYYTGHRFGIRDVLGSRTEISNVDNLWIESLLNVGILGTSLIFLFVIISFKNLINVSRQLNESDRLFLMGTGILLLISTLFNPSLQIPCFQGGVFAALLLAISVLKNHSKIEKQERSLNS